MIQFPRKEPDIPSLLIQAVYRDISRGDNRIFSGGGVQVKSAINSDTSVYFNGIYSLQIRAVCVHA